MMNDPALVMALGAAGGIIGALAYVVWAPRGYADADVPLFLALGILCVVVFSYRVYGGEPLSTRGLRALGFVGPLFLVGALATWLLRKYLARR